MIEEIEGYDEDQLKFRAQHGGLAWDKVREGVSNRTVQERKRDGWMARLFESLTQIQQDAMCDIEAGYMLATSGLGMRIMDPASLMAPGGRSTSDNGAGKVTDYFAWGREIQRRRLSHAMAMAMIAEGLTSRQTDANYRQRKGVAMMNLRAALDVFCELQGWSERRR